MTSRNRTKRQAMIYKTIQRKLCEIRFSGRMDSPLSTSGTRHGTVMWHEQHVMWESCWTPVCVMTN